MSFSSVVQLVGAVFILGGYWSMAKSVKWASLLLIWGCVVWAYWATLVNPFPIWLFILESILGAMSARTFWLNRRAL